MNKKFTIDTIKDLKVKVKEMNEGVLNHYTQNEFKPDNSFRLVTEENDISTLSGSWVDKMILALAEDKTEFESGKILFENLRISPRQASDIGFWTFHNHYTFYQYISKRWGGVWNDEKKLINPSTYIVDHWIQSNSSQGELIRYPISGLWWSFYLTVDTEREDKYELTKLFFKNETLRSRQLGPARFAKYRPAIFGVLEFIKENNLSLEQASRATVPYINLLGGIRPLAYFDKDWFKAKLQKRFGEQIKAKSKLYLRSSVTSVVKQDNVSAVESQLFDYDRFFCLDAQSGNYSILSEFSNDWDYCIGIDFEVENQFLIHFYQEGKIKKSKIDGSLSNKTIDRLKPYSNGKCPKLTLTDVHKINRPVLFGIAYKTSTGIYFKAMDEQNEDNFRTDNSDLNQEGKKILYINEPFKSAYKILPYEIKEVLGTLVQQSSSSKGVDITKKYYSEKWVTLKEYWPELFNGKVKWS